MSRLAVKNIESLYQFYQNVLEEFEKDPEDAFSKIQLSWLGIKGKQAQKIIEDSKLSDKEWLWTKICKAINAELGKEMDRSQAIEFKKTIYKDILMLMNYLEEREKNTEEWTGVHSEIGKNERPITVDEMDYLRKYCGLPYAIKDLPFAEKGKQSAKRKKFKFVRYLEPIEP